MAPPISPAPAADEATAGAAALACLRRLAGRDNAHLLVPIDSAARANWCLSFVLACHRAGWRGEAVMLHVVDAPAPREVVRSGDGVVAQTSSALGAQAELDQAARPLREAGVRVQRAIRSGGVVFAILDAAEELACDAIVVPRARQRMFGVASRGVVYRLERGARGVPIITVDRSGRPSASAGTAP